MKIAITGGTGFVGRYIARRLVGNGHEVVLIARGKDQTDPTIQQMANIQTFRMGLEDVHKLSAAFQGCDAVAHCAGINRELGRQTYQRVHVEGTRNVVEAARKAGVCKIGLISFLRARPNCGSGYHESKWAAEEIVRSSGLDYTVFKCGVIYGKGDHMLDHLSHAFHTFPLFAFVGFQEKPIRPTAVEDIARIVEYAFVTDELSCKTVAVVGPDTLTFRGAVRRVARVVGRSPVMFPMPVWFHYLLGFFVEKLMKVPLVSTAQVKMLAEGLAEPCPSCEFLPPKIAPEIHFSEEQIRKGLPPAGPFTFGDLRCRAKRERPRHSAFLTFP
jgi:NADH dehydrogenase